MRLGCVDDMKAPIKVDTKGGHNISEENLLKRWLSVAESQICALEVLSSQLPKLNQILGENMMSLSVSFNILASEALKQITYKI